MDRRMKIPIKYIVNIVRTRMIDTIVFKAACSVSIEPHINFRTTYSSFLYEGAVYGQHEVLIIGFAFAHPNCAELYIENRCTD